MRKEMTDEEQERSDQHIRWAVRIILAPVLIVAVSYILSKRASSGNLWLFFSVFWLQSLVGLAFYCAILDRNKGP